MHYEKYINTDETYSLEDILDFWEKDEYGIHDYENKGFKTWREWRRYLMLNHGVEIKEWFKKTIIINDVMDFRVGTFGSISQFFVKYLNGDPKNYLKINETKVKFFEKIYSRNQEKIESIMLNLPKEINFIAWERNGEYILTEGHHRAITLARLINQGKKIDGVKINLYYHPVTTKKLLKNIDYI